MLFFFFQAGKKAISHMELTLQLPSVQIQLAQTFHYLGSQLPGLINRIQMFHRIYMNTHLHVLIQDKNTRISVIISNFVTLKTNNLIHKYQGLQT